MMAQGNDAITRFGQRTRASGLGGQLGSPGPRSGGGMPPRLKPEPPRRAPVKMGRLGIGYVCSLLLHGIAAAIIVFGVPALFKRPDPEPQPIAVQMVNKDEFTHATERNEKPIKDAKLVPPKPDAVTKPDQPIPDPLEPPTAAPPPPHVDPPPTPPEPVKQPEPKPAPETPPPLPEPKPELKPEPAPPPPPPKPEPPKPEPPKVPPKPETKPTPPKDKKADMDFEALINNLAKQDKVGVTDKPPKPQKKQVAAPQESVMPDAPIGAKLTTAEKDLLKEQFERCWNPPIGAKGAAELKVHVHVDVDHDGIVTKAEIMDTDRMGDPFFRAAAESARRAALNPACSKLDVPPDKYEDWKSINLTFDPKDLL